VKTPTTPKKNKWKEKVPKPREESLEHMDFHLSSESSGDVHSLIFPLNQLKRGKGGSRLWNVKNGQVSLNMEGSKSKSGGQNVQGIFCLPRCLPNIRGVTRGKHNIEQ
jgi:hypothetical protein